MSTKSMNSEQEPLLPPRHDVERVETKSVTPLPKVQVSILMLFELAEPMNTRIVYTFINQVGFPELNCTLD